MGAPSDHGPLLPRTEVQAAEDMSHAVGALGQTVQLLLGSGVPQCDVMVAMAKLNGALLANVESVIVMQVRSSLIAQMDESRGRYRGRG